MVPQELMKRVWADSNRHLIKTAAATANYVVKGEGGVKAFPPFKDDVILSRIPEAMINHITVTANLAARRAVPKLTSNASIRGIIGG